jgi:DNA-binding transcriptional ArsR family regulator
MRKKKPEPDHATSAMEDLPDAALERVASYFQAFAEPTRLKILNLLRRREHNVGEIAKICGYTPANVSRHLALLASQGLVARESRGTSAWYRIADNSIYALCDLVCDRIARNLREQASDHAAFADAARRKGLPA